MNICAWSHGLRCPACTQLVLHVPLQAWLVGPDWAGITLINFAIQRLVSLVELQCVQTTCFQATFQQMRGTPRQHKGSYMLSCVKESHRLGM